MKPQPWHKTIDLSPEDYQEIVLIDKGKMLYVAIYIGRHEGIWLTGYSLSIGIGSGWHGSFQKNRPLNPKNVGWRNYCDAMESVLNDMISVFINHKLAYPDYPGPSAEAMSILKVKKAEIQGEQLKLFK